MGRVLINGNRWILSCSAEIRGAVNSWWGNINSFMSKGYYDTKRYYTNSYNIFDLKSLHLKTQKYAFKFRIRIRMIFFSI